jgi:hypothetical protein
VVFAIDARGTGTCKGSAGTSGVLTNLDWRG